MAQDQRVYLPGLARVAPGAPGDLTLVATSPFAGRIDFSWSAADRAVVYWVRRTTQPDFRDAEILRTVYPGERLAYVDSGVPLGQVYYYAVGAVNIWGVTQSNIASVHFPVTPTPAPTPTPLIVFNTSITGHLRQDCCVAVPGVRLLLRHFDGARMSIVAETISDPSPLIGQQGMFTFREIPPLGPGQYYQVVFPNAERQPHLVSVWYGSRIATLNQGEHLSESGYTMGTAPLVAPAPGATVGLPATFTWSNPATYGRQYRVLLREIGDNPRTWITREETPPGGSDASITVTNLPSGVEYGRPYEWTILINYRTFNPYDYGVAFETRWVTFHRSNKNEEVTRDGDWLSDRSFPDLFRELVLPMP